MKTLLVQDGISDSAVQSCLAERGYPFVLCRSLAQARLSCEKEEFPLIVLGLKRPVEGSSFCQWFRQRPGYRSKGVILITLAENDLSAWESLLAAGADDFVLRPASGRAVAARLLAVEQQIRRRRRWVDAETTLNNRAQRQVAVAALGECALIEQFSTSCDLASRLIVDGLQVEFCCLLLRPEPDAPLQFVNGFGWRAGVIGSPVPEPPPHSVLGRTLRGEDVLIRALSQEQAEDEADFLNQHQVRSGISVGVRGKGKGVFGVLGAFTGHDREFADDELRFVEGLANVLGAASVREKNQQEIQAHQSQIQHLQRLESVGQVAAGLAHDYNNVLTLIHGHVTLALGAPGLPDAATGSLKIALEAVERAAGLTRQMLSFSRKQVLTPQPVNLNTAVTSMAKLLDRVLGSRIRLNLQLADSLPSAHADPGMVDQVLMNLAVNARDAMPGGGTLTIATSLRRLADDAAKYHPEARPGTFLCVAVTDTGCGMDEATLRRIFDPFFTTKEAGKGTGLGLSTVYGIVKQHQGWVEVESRPGQGATFRVLLPATEEQPVQPVSLPAAVETGKHRVLLVEDEAGLRELARLLLEDLGYDVLEAASGREALDQWAQHRAGIDVLLTDFILPDGMTGFELAERLHGQDPNLRVILTSGYSAEQVSQHKGFHFVQKPYRSETLNRAIRDALAGH